METPESARRVLCSVPGLPNITHVRELFVREPGLSARDIGADVGTDEDSIAETDETEQAT